MNAGRSVDKIEAISGIPADSSSMGRNNSPRCSNRRENRRRRHHQSFPLSRYTSRLRNIRDGRLSRHSFPANLGYRLRKCTSVDIAPMRWAEDFGFMRLRLLTACIRRPIAALCSAVGSGQGSEERSSTMKERSLASEDGRARQRFSHAFGIMLVRIPEIP